MNTVTAIQWKSLMSAKWFYAMFKEQRKHYSISEAYDVTAQIAMSIFVYNRDNWQTYEKRYVSTIPAKY